MTNDTNSNLPTHIRAYCYWAEDGEYWREKVPHAPILIHLTEVASIKDDDQYYHLIPRGADEEVVFFRKPHWIGEGPIDFVTETE